MKTKILILLCISILLLPTISAVTEELVWNIPGEDNDFVIYKTNNISCYTKPHYEYKFCPSDGYIKQQNGYKIIHYTDINYWMNSNNIALQIQGVLWYDIYMGLK